MRDYVPDWPEIKIVRSTDGRAWRGVSMVEGKTIAAVVTATNDPEPLLRSAIAKRGGV